MARRTKADAEKTRADILAAAKDLFEVQGYAGTSVAEICEKASITKGALFHHFENKDKLFGSVWENLQVGMDAEARIAALSGRCKENPYAGFLAGCRVYLDWATRRDYQQIVLTDGPSVLGIAAWYEADFRLGSDNIRAGVNYLAKLGLVEEARIASMSVLLQNALNGAGFALARKDPTVNKKSLLEAFEILLRSAANV